MLGTYSFDTNALFLILSINDYPSAYAGMLKWEPNILSDIGGLFEVRAQASTTKLEFSDEALQNKDLRIVKDLNGNTLFLYSFIDKNTLVLTTNENILTAIMGKYLLSKMVK